MMNTPALLVQSSQCAGHLLKSSFTASSAASQTSGHLVCQSYISSINYLQSKQQSQFILYFFSDRRFDVGDLHSGQNAVRSVEQHRDCGENIFRLSALSSTIGQWQSLCHYEQLLAWGIYRALYTIHFVTQISYLIVQMWCDTLKSLPFFAETRWETHIHRSCCDHQGFAFQYAIDINTAHL